MKTPAPALHLARLLSAFALASAASARAADPQTSVVAMPTSATTAMPAISAPQVDASAMALLKKVQTTMLAAKSYYAECWTTLTYDPIPGKTRPTHYAMSTLTAEKSNLMRYDYWIMDVDAQGNWSKQKELPTDISVSDGKTEWRQSGSVYYTDTLASFLNELDGNQLDDLDAHQEPWTGFYSTIGSEYARTEFMRTDGMGIEKQIGVRRDGTEEVDGIVCDKVFTHYPSLFGSETEEISTTYYIGPDGLIRREVKHIQPGYTLDATLRGIKTNFQIADPKTQFTYTAPQGVTLAK